MDRQEWLKILRPLLVQTSTLDVRKLCQLHRKGPVEESKVLFPGPSDEPIFATINADGAQIWVLSPDIGSVYIEYNANGDKTRLIRSDLIVP